jgi:glucose 1-dehydrogenase
MGDGKTALITGGSRGIGRGVAWAMAAAGYDIALSYATRRDAAEEVADGIRDVHGRACRIFQARLEDPDAADRLADEVLGAFEAVHVLFNNAGRTRMAHVLRMDAGMLDELIRLNYRAPILLTQRIARHMVSRGIRGSILFNTSSRGRRAYPGDSVYGGLKAALNRGVESLALDLAPYGIRVNAIAPGATVDGPAGAAPRYAALAERIPLGRLGRPEDIGQAAVWLASDAASYITGQTLTVDGGLTLPGMPEGKAPGPTEGWNEASKQAPG